MAGKTLDFGDFALQATDGHKLGLERDAFLFQVRRLKDFT